jgi:hypothetical protein
MEEEPDIGILDISVAPELTKGEKEVFGDDERRSFDDLLGNVASLAPVITSLFESLQDISAIEC